MRKVQVAEMVPVDVERQREAGQTLRDASLQSYRRPLVLALLVTSRILMSPGSSDRGGDETLQ